MTLINPQEYREALCNICAKGRRSGLRQRILSQPRITSGGHVATAKCAHLMLSAKVRFSHGTIRQKVATLGGKTMDAAVQRNHTSHRPPSSWKSPLQGVSGGGAVWSSRDFVNHYYRGNGRGVTVRETGHLSAIVDDYMALVDKKLKDQVAREAREKRDGSFSNTFYNTYGMTGVVFSIGDTVIGGEFSGNVEEHHGVLTIEGSFDFYLRDEFADPADIGIEVIDLGGRLSLRISTGPLDNYLRGGRTSLPPRGPQRLGVQTGEPYSITDDWSGQLSGKCIWTLREVPMDRYRPHFVIAICTAVLATAFFWGGSDTLRAASQWFEHRQTSSDRLEQAIFHARYCSKV